MLAFILRRLLQSIAVLLTVVLFALLILPRSEHVKALPTFQPFPASLDVLPNPARSASVDSRAKN